MALEMTRDEADAVLTVLRDAREGASNELHFRHHLGHMPALSEAIRKLAGIAGLAQDQAERLVSRSKRLTDPDDV